MIALLCWSLFLFADVEDLFRARNAQELRWREAQMSRQLFLKQRCDVELAHAYVPVHCFVWLREESLSEEQRNFFQNLFERKCLHVLRRQPFRFPVDSEHFAAAPPQCRARAHERAKDWMYQKERESTLPVEVLAKVGRRFELFSGQNVVAKKKSQRHRFAGASR